MADTAWMNVPEIHGALYLHPSEDLGFREVVESSLGNVAARPVRDEGVLAAAAALLRSTYPMATIQATRSVDPGRKGSWDVFRDAATLDSVLAEQARSGSIDALEQLYDRHHAVAYAAAALTSRGFHAAEDAVIAAFRRLLVAEEERPALQVRVLLARFAHDAALGADAIGEALPRHVPGRHLVSAVVRLARDHGLDRHEIGTILRLDLAGVGALARAAFADAHARAAASVDRPPESHAPTTAATRDIQPGSRS